MPVFLVTLRALAPLFLLILLGYGLKRARVLHAAHVPVLNGLVVNVTLPALIVRGLLTAPSLPQQALILPLALMAAQAATMALAYALGQLSRLPRPMTGALMLVGVFGNTGFLGYPITLALHPAQFPEAILLDQFGMNIMLYLSAPVIGAQFGTQGGGIHAARATILRFLRSPLFLAVLVGALGRVIPWPSSLLRQAPLADVGQVISQCLSYLGQGTTPIVLLALGAALRPSAARDYVRPLLTASMLKLILCPLLMWLICRAMGIHGQLLAQSVLSAAMPSAVMGSVLAAEHDLQGEFAVSAAFGLTILSAITLPLVLAVLH